MKRERERRAPRAEDARLEDQPPRRRLPSADGALRSVERVVHAARGDDDDDAPRVPPRGARARGLASLSLGWKDRAGGARSHLRERGSSARAPSPTRRRRTRARAPRAAPPARRNSRIRPRSRPWPAPPSLASLPLRARAGRKSAIASTAGVARAHAEPSRAPRRRPCPAPSARPYVPTPVDSVALARRPRLRARGGASSRAADGDAAAERGRTGPSGTRHHRLRRREEAARCWESAAGPTRPDGRMIASRGRGRATAAARRPGDEGGGEHAAAVEWGSQRERLDKARLPAVARGSARARTFRRRRARRAAAGRRSGSAVTGPRVGRRIRSNASVGCRLGGRTRRPRFLWAGESPRPFCPGRGGSAEDRHR